jgi:oxygen-independent coproporphyrinogen-3 oxidase
MPEPSPTPGQPDAAAPVTPARDRSLPLAGAAPPRRFASDALRDPGASGVESLYIHTPFCVHKCHYCDFYSFVDSRDQQPAFVERLLRELEALAPHAGPLRTIFVGGGTPSLLRVDLWQRLLRGLDAMFDLSIIRAGRGEWTVECNPESASPELLATLRAGGVDRVSLGAQSFDARHLKSLERWHNPDNVARALDAAADAGIPRRSIDLIFAVPGQSLDDWECDLRTALALGVGREPSAPRRGGLTHLSCYNLTYEPNTAMSVRLQRGEFAPATDDLEADMFQLTRELLADEGLERYEVSNYALAGQESQHNLAYWRAQQWLAAGPSASGHVLANRDDPALGGHRWKNAPSLGVYLDHADASGYAPISDHEPPDPARALRERIMTGVRLREGIETEALLRDSERLIPGSGARLAARAHELVDDGLLEPTAPSTAHAIASEPTRWRVSTRGWLLADWIAKRLMNELDRP